MGELPTDLSTLLEAVEVMMGAEFARGLEAAVDAASYEAANLAGWYDW